MTTLTTTRTIKKPRKRWLWVLGSVLLLGAVGGGIYWNKAKNAKSAEVAVTVNTAQARRGDIRISVSGPGTLEAAATRTVGADLTATVGHVPAVGERVSKGQLITTLASDSVSDSVQAAQLSLDKAQASLDATQATQTSSAAQRQSSVTQAQQSVAQAQQTWEEARTALNGQQKLYDIGAVSNQDVTTARSNVTKAEMGLQNAQTNLNAAQIQMQTGASSDTENLKSAQIAVEQARASLLTAQQAQAKMKVYAPMSGVVSTASATEGTVVTAGSTILTILDDTTLNLPVQIDETEISGVKVGQQTEVTLDAYPEQVFEGQVIRVSPGATQSNGISVFTATVQLPNSDGKLRSGMTAEAEIIQSHASGIVIPSKAIQTVRNRSYVQVPAGADTDGALAGEPGRVRVQTGATDGTNTIITEGLRPGQEVIVPGSARSAASSSSGSRDNQTRGGFSGPPPGQLP